VSGTRQAVAVLLCRPTRRRAAPQVARSLSSRSFSPRPPHTSTQHVGFRSPAAVVNLKLAPATSATARPPVARA
jgi:hypothetical protein